MADFEGFSDNFAAMVGEEMAIPPMTDPELLPDHIKQAIANLDDTQIATLNQLAKDTKSHIFLHDHKNNVICMGL